MLCSSVVSDLFHFSSQRSILRCSRSELFIPFLFHSIALLRFSCLINSVSHPPGHFLSISRRLCAINSTASRRPSVLFRHKSCRCGAFPVLFLPDRFQFQSCLFTSGSSPSLLCQSVSGLYNSNPFLSVPSPGENRRRASVFIQPQSSSALASASSSCRRSRHLAGLPSTRPAPGRRTQGIRSTISPQSPSCCHELT